MPGTPLPRRTVLDELRRARDPHSPGSQVALHLNSTGSLPLRLPTYHATALFCVASYRRCRDLTPHGHHLLHSGASRSIDGSRAPSRSINPQSRSTAVDLRRTSPEIQRPSIQHPGFIRNRSGEGLHRNPLRLKPFLTLNFHSHDRRGGALGVNVSIWVMLRHP